VIKIVIETELIEKIKDGDGRAFAELYNRYAEYALRTGTAVTRNSAWAADAVQENLKRKWQNREKGVHFMDDFLGKKIKDALTKGTEQSVSSGNITSERPPKAMGPGFIIC
jgi:hypothetical protein